MITFEVPKEKRLHAWQLQNLTDKIYNGFSSGEYLATSSNK